LTGEGLGGGGAVFGSVARNSSADIRRTGGGGREGEDGTVGEPRSDGGPEGPGDEATNGGGRVGVAQSCGSECGAGEGGRGAGPKTAERLAVPRGRGLSAVRDKDRRIDGWGGGGVGVPGRVSGGGGRGCEAWEGTGEAGGGEGGVGCRILR